MSDLARTPKQIGAVVRRARRQCGWNQSHLGERAGVRQETGSAIETGTAVARIETILAILAALDLELRIAPRTRTDAADIESLF